jgi:replicative DNA helicase
MSVSLGDVLDRWPDIDDRPVGAFDLGETFNAVLPLAPEQVGVLGGGPGVAKTAMGLQLTVSALIGSDKLAAVIQNVEMTAGRLVERIVAHVAGVPVGDVRAPAPAQMAAVQTALDRLAAAGDRLHFVTSDAVEDAIEAANETEAGLIMIDYVQRVRLRSSGRSDSREMLNEVVQWTRRLALEGAAVLLVSTVGKATRYRKLGLDAFRDSSEIEFGVDFAAVLEAPDGVDHPARTLNVCKNRYGPTRVVPLTFDAERMTFSAGEADVSPGDTWDDEDDQ